MDKTKILVLAYSGRATDVFTPGNAYCRELAERFPRCEFRFTEIGKQSMEDMLWADVVTGHPPAEQLKKAPNIKWVHIQSAGVEGYTDRSVFATPDVIVTRTADVFSVAIAEHVVGMMLALCRLLPMYMRRQAAGEWLRDYREDAEICGSNILMLGTGSLASEIVKRLKGFECKISGVRRDISKPSEGYDRIYAEAELHEALSGADFVVNTLPMTDRTHNYLSSDEFGAMKRGAFFVNVGRGGTVDTAELVKALQSGKLAGAGLDVTDPEPLNADSPLWGMENVIITPHTSGFSGNTDRRRLELFAGLITKYLAGEPLEWQIDFSAGY